MKLSELRRQYREAANAAKAAHYNICGLHTDDLIRLLDALDRAEKIAVAALGEKLALAALEGGDDDRS